MKTISFALSLLFLVSCGKDNKSGSRPEPHFRTDPIVTDAEITEVTNTRNGVMVQGTQANFAIPVTRVTNIFRSRNLVGVIYDQGGLRVKIYNALGRAVFNQNMIMRQPRVNVGDDVAAIDYIDSRGRNRVLAVNTFGKVLLKITAEAIRAKADYGVVAITFRTNTGERAIAMKANGKILLRDNRNYSQPRFTIDPYVLILRHSQGVEQIAH
jgi:hypothetical protein